MSDIAIRACHLSKQYRIGGENLWYPTLRHSLTKAVTAPFRRWRNGGSPSGNGQATLSSKAAKSSTNTFWALHDVEFDILSGEVVGIIGRNGAGKSTLLKILSRITEPTHGYADIHGRVGSLLEVGTGFHPELTGRENIILNGAILGMRRSEIEKKFDEIVAFAEVEQFMNTPVKHYSTGMYLRLAFAVAAHLEPEILLVDEVLAVGDAAFQQKCLGRMQGVAKQGRTVIFVSHNMGAIRTLCTKGIVLEQGRVVMIGNTADCVTAYYKSIGALQSESKDVTLGAASETNHCGQVIINGAPGNTVLQSQPMEISTLLTIDREITGFKVIFNLEDMQGQQILRLKQASTDMEVKKLDPGKYRVTVRLPPLWLNAGIYSAHFRVLFWEQTDTPPYVSDKFPIDVTGDGGTTGSILQPKVDWTFDPVEGAE